MQPSSRMMEEEDRCSPADPDLDNFRSAITGSGADASLLLLPSSLSSSSPSPATLIMSERTDAPA